MSFLISCESPVTLISLGFVTSKHFFNGCTLPVKLREDG